MALSVALSLDAADRLYINDFSIQAGQSLQLSLILDNETQYTAFQTDIYLPQGLMVEKVDDEFAFELTSRKSSDHVVMSQDKSNGVIRLMSYSMSASPFKGNSGALVTFTVTASDDFNGNATIGLKNTLFTDLNDQEVQFANEICQVLPAADVLGDVNGDGIIDVYDVVQLIDNVLGKETYEISLANADLNHDGILDVVDVIALIDYVLNGPSTAS